jgi:hypothetical protein
MFQEVSSKEDVISIIDFNLNRIVIQQPMFKVGQFIDEAQKLLTGGRTDQRVVGWLVKGIDCEYLKLSKNKWQTGKVRVKVTLEFCPDESESLEPASPLDDIRSMINDNSEVNAVESTPS